MSDKIVTHTGSLFHVPGDNRDTDQIIPARYLKCVTFEGIEAGLFRDLRDQCQGVHPLDDPANAEASVMLVDENFGCGSSREHAPQAIMRWGIKVLIGKSFADIFRGNCTANGIVCLDVADEVHAFLASAAQVRSSVEVNLDDMTITIKGSPQTGVTSVSMPTDHRRQLREGKWDAVSVLLEADGKIDEVAVACGYTE